MAPRGGPSPSVAARPEKAQVTSGGGASLGGMPPGSLITVEEHLAQVLETLAPLGPVELGLAEAHGLVLAEPVLAAADLPAFDNSAMDGYAVRHADVADASASPVVLEVVAELAAGSGADPALAQGQAARIMTGAPIPRDADAIVQVEHTDAGTERVTVTVAPPLGAHIRRRGDELRAGDLVMPAGVRLGPWQIGAAAAAGVASVSVRRAPRVAVIATGSELVDPGAPLERGQIHESNSRLLAALVVAGGGEVARVSVVADDESALQAELEACAGLDLVVLTGGVSVGAYDIVKSLLQPLGGVSFVTVAMQPGKPQAFGRLSSGVPVFGLPGNPVSVAVSFEVFVRPALLALQGSTELHRREIRATAAVDWRSPAGRRQYRPVTLDTSGPVPVVRPVSAGGSHLIASLARAHGLAIVEADVDEVRAGDEVLVMLVTP